MMLFIVTHHAYSIRHRKTLLIAFYSLSIVCFLQTYKASAPYVLNLRTMIRKGKKVNYKGLQVFGVIRFATCV